MSFREDGGKEEKNVLIACSVLIYTKMRAHFYDVQMSWLSSTLFALNIKEPNIKHFQPMHVSWNNHQMGSH